MMKKNINEVDETQMFLRMSVLKVLTLKKYKTKKELDRYHGCDYEFDVDGKTNIPKTLHVWRGKNHNYKEKYHEAFDIPSKLRFPLF